MQIGDQGVDSRIIRIWEKTKAGAGKIGNGIWPKHGLRPSSPPSSRTAQRCSARACAQPRLAQQRHRGPGATAAQHRASPRPAEPKTPHPARLTGGPRLSSPTSPLIPLLFPRPLPAMVTPPAPAFDRTSADWMAPTRWQPPRDPKP